MERFEIENPNELETQALHCRHASFPGQSLDKNLDHLIKEIMLG
jgi:hypothetical protein